jgi:two-component system sensor histidine kinase BaeS
VDDLLALARLDSRQLRPFQLLDVATLAEEAVVRARAIGGPTIVNDVPGGLWVSGDPDQLDQALLNLMRNAITHTPVAGTVTVSARVEGDNVVISIRDTGAGIRTEDLPRLFDRFYRSQGPRAATSGGSGLGLAITKRLVELHQGTIEAHNAVGGGAIFTLRLRKQSAPKDA